jgi:hypothetical protein
MIPKIVVLTMGDLNISLDRARRIVFETKMKRFQLISGQTTGGSVRINC